MNRELHVFMVVNCESAIKCGVNREIKIKWREREFAKKLRDS